MIERSELEKILFDSVKADSSKAMSVLIDLNRVTARIAKPVREAILSVLKTRGGQELMVISELRVVISEIVGESPGDLQCEVVEHDAAATLLSQKDLDKARRALTAIDLITKCMDPIEISPIDFAIKVGNSINPDDHNDGIHKIVGSSVALEAAEIAFPPDEVESHTSRDAFSRMFSEMTVSNIFTQIVTDVFTKRTSKLD